MKQEKLDFKDVVLSRINTTERRLLKKFVDSVRSDTWGCNASERLREGVVLLTLVRKRALEDAKGEANLIILKGFKEIKNGN